MPDHRTPDRVKRTLPHARKPVERDIEASVDQAVRQRIEDSPYAYYFNRVMWHFEQRRLVLSGCVPTFYMKQILQTLLRDVEDVEQIVNNVNVIGSTRLSQITT